MSAFAASREIGRVAADLCAQNAERDTAFDTRAAAAQILTLLEDGDASGEALVDACIAAGHVPHDARAFGSVFARLVREGRIRCVGYGLRSKGHATAGGRIWRLA